MMAGALEANLDCETKIEGAWDFCVREASISALDFLHLDFI